MATSFSDMNELLNQMPGTYFVITNGIKPYSTTGSVYNYELQLNQIYYIESIEGKKIRYKLHISGRTTDTLEIDDRLKAPKGAYRIYVSESKDDLTRGALIPKRIRPKTAPPERVITQKTPIRSSSTPKAVTPGRIVDERSTRRSGILREAEEPRGVSRRSGILRQAEEADGSELFVKTGTRPPRLITESSEKPPVQSARTVRRERPPTTHRKMTAEEYAVELEKKEEERIAEELKEYIKLDDTGEPFLSDAEKMLLITVDLRKFIDKLKGKQFLHKHKVTKELKEYLNTVEEDRFASGRFVINKVYVKKERLGYSDSNKVKFTVTEYSKEGNIYCEARDNSAYEYTFYTLSEEDFDKLVKKELNILDKSVSRDIATGLSALTGTREEFKPCIKRDGSVIELTGGLNKKKYKGRYYKIRTGSRGGKYIVVKGDKIYV